MTHLLMVKNILDRKKKFYSNFKESEDLSGATVLVMWTSLLQLLCKCRKPGCAAAVLPDNIRPVRNGEYMSEQYYDWFNFDPGCLRVTTVLRSEIFPESVPRVF